jgi:glycine dehydrogenase
LSSSLIGYIMKSTSLYEAPFDMRHIGPSVREEQEMLATLGVASLDELIDQTVPSHIRLTAPLDLPEGMGEHSYLAMLKAKAEKNQLFRSYIGLGYYNCHTPSVIRRNILENPGWYTSYTPYQAEISQGRLEAILNYQTMVADLTGMEIANASLLDEGTAAAEAMIMARGIVSRSAARKGSLKFFVCNGVLPQTADVLATRAEPLGYELVRGDFASIALDESFFGVLLQYPALDGKVHDYRAFVEKAHALGLVVVLRHQADLRAANARSHHGRVGGSPGQSRISHDLADARAAYPP